MFNTGNVSLCSTLNNSALCSTSCGTKLIRRGAPDAADGASANSNGAKCHNPDGKRITKYLTSVVPKLSVA